MSFPSNKFLSDILVQQEAKDLIKKTMTEEKKMYMENNGPEQELVVSGKVPPAPVLLSRTDTTAVLRPAAFEPATNEKVDLKP